MTSKQKTVIVTGASQGIGAGVVQAFLKRGYNVVDTSRSATKSKELQPGRLHLYHTACSQTDAGTKVRRQHREHHPFFC